MNTSIHTFNQEELSNFKNTELATVYNKFAAELVGVKPIKKFADKKSALRRTSAIQVDYQLAVTALEDAKHQAEKLGVAKKSPAKKKAAVKDDTKIHGLNKNFEVQINVGTKIRKGTILALIAEARDINRIYEVEDVINFMVNSAPKNTNRKEMTSAYAAEYIKWYANKGNITLIGPGYEEE